MGNGILGISRQYKTAGQSGIVSDDDETDGWYSEIAKKYPRGQIQSAQMTPKAHDGPLAIKGGSTETNNNTGWAEPRYGGCESTPTQ